MLGIARTDLADFDVLRRLGGINVPAAVVARGNEVKLLGQSVTLLSEACGQSDTPICVQIPAHRLGEEDILALKAILEAHPGNVEAEAMVLLDGVRCHLTLGPQFRVSPGPELDRALAAWAG